MNGDGDSEFSSTIGTDSAVMPCPYAVASGRLEVLVLGEDDSPLDGVVVELQRGQNEAIRSTSDSAGMVFFAGISGAPLCIACPRLDASAWQVLRAEPIEPGPPAAAHWRPLCPAAQDGIAHTVVQGETVARLAAAHGLAPQALWMHERNKALHPGRELPDVLAPGDLLWLPGIEARTETASLNTRYVLRRIGVPARLHLQFVNLDQSPRAGAPYLLVLSTVDGTPVASRNGQTDAQGVILEWVPPSTRSAEVHIGPPDDREHHVFQVGHLDPVSTNCGVQSRLNNLGYHCGNEDGIIGPRTRIALEAFQIDQEIEPVGTLDNATRSALRSVHGS